MCSRGPAAVGAVAPGEAAWQANLHVGDQVLEINGKPIERFTDLRSSVSLGDIAHGLTMRIRRPGVQEPFNVTVEPDKKDHGPDDRRDATHWTRPWARSSPPAYPGTVAAEAQPSFQGGDKIVAIEDTPVTQYVDIHRQLALHPDKPLHVIVERQSSVNRRRYGHRNGAGPHRAGRDCAPPQPMYRLGLVMKMGPITAVQSQSPAAEAGVQPGDVLTEIDGKPAGDPVTLADRLRQRALRGERVDLSVDRNGQTRQFENVGLRQADWYEWPIMPWSPLSVARLGNRLRGATHRGFGCQGQPGGPSRDGARRRGAPRKVIPPAKEQLVRLLGDAGKDVHLEPISIDFERRELEKRRSPGLISCSPCSMWSKTARCRCSPGPRSN